MNRITSIFLLLAVLNVVAQESSKFTTKEITVNPLISGTLYIPQQKASKLVILIAGSGPTDRNGNQSSAQNNSLKFFAEALAGNGTAVFSYDKRIIAQMKSGNINERELSFDDFVNDASDVVTYFRGQKMYSKIIIAGHSEGSLIGMIAAQRNIDGYISLEGAGRRIDEIITEQISKQAPTMKDELQQDFAILKSGKTFELKNQMLSVIFRESVQPYMISWLKYDPQAEIKKLKIPTLIVNGTKDNQVGVADAQLLQAAKPDAKLKIITGMNHVLKEITGDDASNIASYSNPDLPVMPELIAAVNQFIKSI